MKNHTQGRNADACNFLPTKPLLGAIKRDRHIYIFDCSNCGRPQCYSLKRRRARQGKCRDCRLETQRVNPNQQTLFKPYETITN